MSFDPDHESIIGPPECIVCRRKLEDGYNLLRAQCADAALQGEEKQ